MTSKNLREHLAAELHALEGIQITQAIMVRHSHSLRALRKEAYVYHAAYDVAPFLGNYFVVLLTSNHLVLLRRATGISAKLHLTQRLKFMALLQLVCLLACGCASGWIAFFSNTCLHLHVQNNVARVDSRSLSAAANGQDKLLSLFASNGSSLDVPCLQVGNYLWTKA